MKHISVNLNQKIGTIKPMHGVVNGPYNDAFPFTDTTEYFKEAAIPFVRLHDTIYPNSSEVDISVVFPDFDADPSDPDSYDFAKTDLYLKKIHETGAEIRYRLGENIEHHRIKRNTIPPKDPQKWAQICVGIMKHYNHGWANGFHYNIRYWEIWEEPDGKALWSGTPLEFYQLYEAAATALKAEDPTILIGGYASCGIYTHGEFMEGFFDYVVNHKLPLDFFSFDAYVNDVNRLYDMAALTREALDRYGLTDTELRVAEWNTAGFVEGSLFRCGPKVQTEKFERQRSHMGASFYAANLLHLQDSALSDAALFAVNCTSEWSLFNYFGYPYKSYYGFASFGQLYRCRTRVQVQVEQDPNENPVYCCAGIGEQSFDGAVLLSNFDSGSGTYSVEIQGEEGKPYQWELLIVDEERDMEQVSSGFFAGTGCVTFELKEYSIALIKLKQESV